MKRILLSMAPAVMLTLLVSPALAAPVVAADVDGGFAVGDAASWNSATFSMTARAGYELNLSRALFVGPEAGVGYTVVGDARGIADGSSVLPSEPEIVRLFGGLRGGLRSGDDGRWASSLFVRGGYASVTGGAEVTRQADAPLLDVGIAIDYALPSVLRLGGHVGFETLWAADYGGPFTAVHAGVGLTLVFGGEARPSAQTVAAR